MDNSCARWAPRPPLVVLGWILAAAGALGTAVLSGSTDSAAPLLCGLGTVLVALAAAHGTLLRPRLYADTRGIRIRTLTGTRWLRWPEVRFRVVTTRRFGRELTTLELDPETDTETDAAQLVVFGWLELGTDPVEAHDQLEALRTGSANPE